MPALAGLDFALVSHYLEINGIRATTARIRVPFNGRWVASVDLDGTDEISLSQNGVLLAVGNSRFRGTVDPDHSGTFGLRRKLQIIGGLGWDRTVPATAKHNDAGIKLSTVLQGLAAEVGETVVDIQDRVIGRKYVRDRGPAVFALSDLLTSWHVDYEGVTHCRAPQGGTAGECEILEYDPRARTAVIATLNPGEIPRGAILTNARLDAPLTVRALDITVSDDKARIEVWGA